MRPLTIYVEGGGKGDLRIACRRGFNKLLSRAGLAGSMPSVVACGSRPAALEQFADASARRENAILLADSETAVATTTPWAHVMSNERWQRPETATDDDLHFMARAMEAWLLADRLALEVYFSKNFDVAQPPPAGRSLESVDSKDLERALDRAAQRTAKKGYRKGAHSFELLACIDPNKVAASSPWARRFFDEVRKRAGAPAVVR